MRGSVHDASSPRPDSPTFEEDVRQEAEKLLEKEEKSLYTQASLRHRIYFFFSEPQTGVGAKVMSLVIMILILISSAAFVVSTVPAYRDAPLDAETRTLDLRAGSLVHFEA